MTSFSLAVSLVRLGKAVVFPKARIYRVFGQVVAQFQLGSSEMTGCMFLSVGPRGANQRLRGE